MTNNKHDILFKRFIYLIERQIAKRETEGERQMDLLSAISCAQMATTARFRLGVSQEPGNPSESLTWVAGAQELELSSAIFQM